MAYLEVLKFREGRNQGELSLSQQFLERIAGTMAEVSDLLEFRGEAFNDCMDRLSEPDRELITRRYAPGASVKRLAADSTPGPLRLQVAGADPQEVGGLHRSPPGGGTAMTPEFEELLRAMCDDCLTPEQARRLEELVIADDGACWQYLRQVHLHGALHWNIGHAGTRPSSFRLDTAEVPSPAVGVGLELAGAGVALPLEALVGPAVETPHQPDSLGEEPGPPIPRIIIHDSSLVEPPLWSTLFAPGGWAFSYAAATVIMGMAILGAWVYKVSNSSSRGLSAPGSLAAAVETSPGADSPRPAKPELVGHITGTAGCRWADPQDAPPVAVPLGRKYQLASGLLEITYQSGAKVILEGPCAYEVDSAAGGFLGLGKLTVRVEKLSAISDQLSEISKSPNLQISKFVVRTPTATVTDLGTEFGVEVDKSGGYAHRRFFRGRVVFCGLARARKPAEQQTNSLGRR